MSIQIFSATIEGRAPLLLHNIRLADPLDPFTVELKALTSIRKKTDEILHQIMIAEWRGGFYTDEDNHPIIPSRMLDAVIVAGAKKSKSGGQAKSSCLVTKDARIILPKLKDATVKDLEGKPEFVSRVAAKVGTSRVMRTRPIFSRWSLTFEVQVDNEEFPRKTLETSIQDAGRLVGVGDWRPKHGRFELVELKGIL